MYFRFVIAFIVNKYYGNVVRMDLRNVQLGFYYLTRKGNLYRGLIVYT